MSTSDRSALARLRPTPNPSDTPRTARPEVPCQDPALLPRPPGADRPGPRPAKPTRMPERLRTFLCRVGLHRYRPIPGSEHGLAHDERCRRCGAIATFTYPGV